MAIYLREYIMPTPSFLMPPLVFGCIYVRINKSFLSTPNLLDPTVESEKVRHVENVGSENLYRLPW